MQDEFERRMNPLYEDNEVRYYVCISIFAKIRAMRKYADMVRKLLSHALRSE